MVLVDGVERLVERKIHTDLNTKVNTNDEVVRHNLFAELKETHPNDTVGVRFIKKTRV
jgi:hypothetical protein